ncbi:MAG: hypothetical protein IJV26_04315, partial [Lachnospiraceae bacterium]|nr:hypothetical protein [Lachnospiraceae bacterium]
MSSMYDNISEIWKNDISFLQTISELSGLPVALWRTGGLLLQTAWSSCEPAGHPCLSHEPLRLALEEYGRSDRPSIYFENDQVIYGIMPIGSFSLAIGPAAVWAATEEYEQEYARSHGLSAPVSIPRKDLGDLSRYLELAYIHFTGSAISEGEIPVTADILENWQHSGDLEEYQLDQSENDRSHQPGIDYENDLLRIVESGDTEALKKALLGPTPDYAQIGKLTEESRKDYEYLVVSIITLLTRAAVAGGAGTETAHELGDVYLKRLANAVLRNESFLGLAYNAMIEFTELVRRAREEKSSFSYVNAC